MLIPDVAYSASLLFMFLVTLLLIMVVSLRYGRFTGAHLRVFFAFLIVGIFSLVGGFQYRPEDSISLTEYLADVLNSIGIEIIGACIFLILLQQAWSSAEERREREQERIQQTNTQTERSPETWFDWSI